MRTLMLLAVCVAGCGTEIGRGNGNGTDDGGTGVDGAAHDLEPRDGATVDGAGPSCANMADLTGCGCTTPGATRACYRGPAGTRNVGACHDGTQSCQAMGEFSYWSACTGEQDPSAEVCSDTKDHNCNGKVGCDDPACAGMTGCCTSGQSRACYDGPGGTEGVGICKGGTQTCGTSGAWSTCAGEVTPGSELGHCSDGLDNDCNGMTDCKDFVCLLDPSCQPKQCTSGQTQPCYDGPAGTEGVGPCHGGTQACASDGSSWGACMGEVTPGSEGGHCSDGIDNDCNGATDCADPACATATSCCTSTSSGADTTIWAHSPTDLYRVDPTTLAITHVGAFNVGDQMTDLAVTPSGTLYTISFTTLYTVDKNSAQATKVMDIPGNANNSMTFLPNGNLLVADSTGALEKVDPSTGAITSIGSYGNGYGSSGDLVAVESGILYGISQNAKGGGDASSDNVLLRVDPTSGAATGVGPIGSGNVWGLAYANARVIAFANDGTILRIDPQTGAGTKVASTGIAWWGAGMSPLVTDNPCP